MDSTSRPSLFALPRELRDEIYSYVFLEERVKILRKGTCAHTSGLILASKQTHAESIKYFYRDSTFCTGSNRNLYMWLRMIPPHRRCLITRICCYREFFTSDVYMHDCGYLWGKPEWQPLDWDSVGDHEDALLAQVLGVLNGSSSCATGIGLRPGVLVMESKDMKLQRLRKADRRAAKLLPNRGDAWSDCEDLVAYTWALSFPTGPGLCLGSV